MKDGVKIEVFVNEKGEYYQKDSSGKIVLLNASEVESIITETKKI